MPNRYQTGLRHSGPNQAKLDGQTTTPFLNSLTTQFRLQLSNFELVLIIMNLLMWFASYAWMQRCYILFYFIHTHDLRQTTLYDEQHYIHVVNIPLTKHIHIHMIERQVRTHTHTHTQFLLDLFYCINLHYIALHTSFFLCVIMNPQFLTMTIE